MRRLITASLIALMASSAVGCAYADMTSHEGKLIVARDGFFGITRNVYTCTPDGSGNMSCVKAENKP